MMKQLISDNIYPLLVAGCGLIIALLFLVLGFFKTIFLILLTVGGFYLGRYLEKTGWFTKFMDKQ